ncbi:MAG: hypothetical protein AB7F89_23710, partial [Pirellulaceae bacterium]
MERRVRNLAFQKLEGRQMLAVITWTNDAGGAWSGISNWDPPRLPAADDDVVIPSFETTPMITVGSGVFAARSLVAAEKLVIQGTLSVSTTLDSSAS